MANSDYTDCKIANKKSPLVKSEVITSRFLKRLLEKIWKENHCSKAILIFTT